MENLKELLKNKNTLNRKYRKIGIVFCITGIIAVASILSLLWTGDIFLVVISAGILLMPPYLALSKLKEIEQCKNQIDCKIAELAEPKICIHN